MEEALLPGSDQSTQEHQPTARRHDRREFLAAVAAATGLPMLAEASPARAEEPFAADRDPLLTTKNPVIVKARDAALDALKPSKAQLEHGLELHRRSLVFDAYGFAPRAALDAQAVSAAFNAGASDAELNDLQEEQGMLRALADADERTEFAEAMRCAGVTCIFQNAGEEGQDLGRLIKRLARFTHLSDMLRDTLRRASLPEDILAAKKEGRYCLYLTGNGVPLPQTWNTVEEELGYVRLFYQLGIRMMHLTYNRRNMLGDGCAEPANGGISDFGRAAIAEMNRVGVIVDVAHSGWKTSLEAARASRKPMVASHTVCAGLRHHIRAKPDEVLKAIAATGGLIGICWIPQFLGGQGDIVALLDHIDYAVKQVSVDHVAIGTDASHSSQHASKIKGKLPPRRKQHPRFAALWPPDALSGTYLRSITLGWTNWPLVTVGLVQRGYKDEEISKILGGNVLRVCKEVLPK